MELKITCVGADSIKLINSSVHIVHIMTRFVEPLGHLSVHRDDLMKKVLHIVVVTNCEERKTHIHVIGRLWESEENDEIAFRLAALLSVLRKYYHRNNVMKSSLNQDSVMRIFTPLSRTRIGEKRRACRIVVVVKYKIHSLTWNEIQIYSREISS